MGVHWAACHMRWRPHQSHDGAAYSLGHLHPFQFTVVYEPYKGMPPRVVAVHVGFSTHVFTRRVDCGGEDLEIYQDERERRTFDDERYLRSKSLREIVAGLESRKCFHTQSGNYFTMEVAGLPANTEYRVFFAVRKRNGSVVELIVQSAYTGSIEQRRAGPKSKPVGFRVIVMEALRGRKPTLPP